MALPSDLESLVKKLAVLLLPRLHSPRSPSNFAALTSVNRSRILQIAHRGKRENFNPITKNMENYAKGSADLSVA